MTGRTSQTQHPRAVKLERLADVLDLETGDVYGNAFLDVRSMYDLAVRAKRQARRTLEYCNGTVIHSQQPITIGQAKQIDRMRELNRQMRACRRCSGLNCPGMTEVTVPWGDVDADIMIVGQSAHRYAMLSDMPFVLESGFYLDAACYLSRISRTSLAIHNVVACHPDRNRASLESWKDNCHEYLARAVEIVHPKLLVALGNDATFACDKVVAELQTDCRRLNMTHPAAFLHSSGGSDKIVDWVVRLSDAFDKILTQVSEVKTRRDKVKQD